MMTGEFFNCNIVFATGGYLKSSW